MPVTHRVSRIAVVIFAIAAMLCVSAAAVTATHTHLRAPDDQCSICTSAHMVAQQVAVIRVTHALELLSFLAPPAPVQRVESRLVLALQTRGPPSFL